MSYKFYFVFFFISSLTLSSCLGGKDKKIPQINFSEATESEASLSQEEKNIIKNRCIQDRFVQGSDDNLYGIDCIEGKHLLIQTSKKGDAVSTSHAVNKEKGTSGLRLEKKLDFINKFYKSNYTILKDKGDDKKISFLRDLLPEDERFFGSLNKKYRIIFETKGNYLVLFKASKDLNDLPYTERTSAIRSKDGKFHMVPFIGYPITYCNPEAFKNNLEEKTGKHRANCQNNLSSKDSKYISIQTSNKQVYRYLNKKDLFPASYFEGQWFFSSGPIETPDREGELAPLRASLVELSKQSNHMKVIDVSGDVEERNRKLLEKIPVQWVEYEMARNGMTFDEFGERETNTETIERSHLKIDFSKMIEEGKEAEDILITNDYFSYVFEQPVSIKTVRDRRGRSIPIIVPDKNGDKSAKYKVSFLRKKAVDIQGFAPRRVFKDDHDHVFGTMITAPQNERKMAEFGKDEHLSHYRMMYFNTHLNSPEEQKEKTKIIKWHFSKNSTKDEYYRNIAREAVRLWNRAFEIITEDSDKKIRVELAEAEGDKDLGDLRYNIVNLIQTEDIVDSGRRGILLGMAPSYAYSDTGQIIGTTANIVIHNILEFYHTSVRNYIRYEVFQKDKKTEEENNFHVVSSYLRSKIEKQCPEVKTLIISSKRSSVDPRDSLGDRDIILPCGKNLARDSLLFTILHEMGHSFGLAHNFKASVDEDNYYESLAEVKKYFPEAQISSEELSKTSSVMDYLPVQGVPKMQYFGKYDLAALRYLYMDQMERKGGGEPLNLDTPPEVSKQKSLSKSVLFQRKSYLYCSDAVKTAEDFLCRHRDYGSNPLEIVTLYIEEFKRGLNRRYFYDGFHQDPNLNSIPIFQLSNIISFYIKWIQLRDEYLTSRDQLEKANYILKDSDSIEEYKKIVKEGLQTGGEYALYYPIRDVVSSFIMDLLFLETMKCKVMATNEDKTYTLDLETIKSNLVAIHGDKLYVEDCYSPMVINFLKENHLTLQDQMGIEAFVSYYEKGVGEKVDLINLPRLITGLYTSVYPSKLFAWTSEPDFLKEFNVRLEKALLNETDIDKSQFDLKKIAYNLYPNFIGSLQVMLKYPTVNTAILRNNLNHLLSAHYINGTGVKSFYQRVQEPLSNGWGIGNIGIPFLINAHKDFEIKKADSNYNDSFEDYLRGRNDVINDGISGGFIIPFKTGSLSRKMIFKYKKNLREIKKFNRLEKTRNLSFLEQVSRSAKKQHNEDLKQVILKLTAN